MMKKKVFVVFLAVFCLAAALFAVTPTRSSPGVGEYNPWYDLNDDGVVDGADNIEINRAWGSWGTPIVKASLEYDSGWINITDKQGQNIPIYHSLGSADLIVDITGKTTETGLSHQRNLGSIVKMPGWKTTVVAAPGVDAYGRSMAMTDDGGYVIAGTTTSSPDWDYILVKTDEYGDVQWQRRYLKTGTDDAYSVVQASDGGYVIAGTSQNTSGTYACIVKLNSTGYKLWGTTFGTAGQTYAVYSVIEADGCYIAAGRTNGWSGTYDFWLMKLETVFGYVFWGVAYTTPYAEYAASVVQATDHSGYVLAGYTTQGWSGMLLKTDVNGIYQWNKTYAGNGEDYVLDLVQTADFGYALAGYTRFVSSSSDFWLVKTDANGNALWSKTYGGYTWDEVRALVQTTDLGYALAGYTSSFGAGGADLWLVRTDVDGNALWNKTYGGTACDEAWALVQMDDGGLLLAGYSNSFGSGEYDIWLVKTPVESGLAMVYSHPLVIVLYRGAEDQYWNYVRVQIWKPK